MRLPRSFFVLALGLLPAVAAAAPCGIICSAWCRAITRSVSSSKTSRPGKAGWGAILSAEIRESPLFKQFQIRPELAKDSAGLRQAIFRELGVTPEQFRDDILGDALVFAFRKGPPGQPEKDDGLIMLHARDAKLLARLVDRVNELQTKAGELKRVEAVDAKPGRYFRRVKAGEKEGARVLRADRQPTGFLGKRDTVNLNACGAWRERSRSRRLSSE